MPYEGNPDDFPKQETVTRSLTEVLARPQSFDELREALQQAADSEGNVVLENSPQHKEARVQAHNVTTLLEQLDQEIDRLNRWDQWVVDKHDPMDFPEKGSVFGDDETLSRLAMVVLSLQTKEASVRHEYDLSHGEPNNERHAA